MESRTSSSISSSMKILTATIFFFSLTVSSIPLPSQVWNHIGPDNYGLIAPASALWGRKLILTGGNDGWKNLSSEWAYNLFESPDWTLTPEGLEDLFQSRSHHTSNVYRDYLFTLGGNKNVSSTFLEAQQLIDGDEHIQFTGPGPHRRVGHTATLRDQELYVYGGWDLVHESYSGALWKCNLRYGELQWELIEYNSPCGGRAGHTAILYQESLYIFGGQSEKGFLNDVWRYDFITGEWIRAFEGNVGDIPAPRVGHAGVYWSDEGMYIWGGYNEADSFLNDMWRFDLQLEAWEKIFEGEKAGYSASTFEVPSPRAYFAYTIYDGKFIILGGQVSQGGVKQVFWSPHTRYVPITHPDDFAGDAWSYDFCTHKWTFIACLPPWANTTVVYTPRQCRSHFAPKCKNHCSGNGVCVRDNQCICRGEWQKDDCSYNVCFEQRFLGYDINLMDRVLISESILGLGKNLARLRNKLEYIRDRLPPYEEFTSCLRFNPLIGQIARDEVSRDGLTFNNDVESSLLPVVHDFNVVLEETHEQNFYLPYSYPEEPAFLTQ